MTFLHLTPEEFFRFKQAHPLIIDLLVFRYLGRDWLEWEPETIRQELTQAVGVIDELTWAKIQAVKALHVNPFFCFSQWEVFLPVITALNNVIPSFDYVQAPTVPRLYAGVDIMRTVEAEEPFGDEVRRFVAASCLHRGTYCTPEELEFAQPLLRRPFYVCDVCKNHEFVADDHDGICDACGKDWRQKATGSVKENAPRVTPQFTYDDGPVRRRLEQALADPDNFVPHDDVPEDVQAARLLVAFQYRDHRRTQFAEQKEFLKL